MKTILLSIYALIVSVNFCFSQTTQPRIVLEQTPCFGTCHVYTISFYDDCRVLYKGVRFAEKIGDFEMNISTSQRDSIYTAFKKAKFFKLKNYYKTKMTDGPSTIVTYNYNGRTKRIIDEGPAPTKLKELEVKLIEIANKKEGWVKLKDINEK